MSEMGPIMADAKKKGRTMAIADAWIAATALAYSIPLVTHNYKDFKNVSGLKVVTQPSEAENK